MAFLVFRNALRGHRLAILLGALLLLGFNLLIPTTYQEIGQGALSSFLEHAPKGVEAFLKAEGNVMAAAGANGYSATGYRHPIFLIVPIGFMVAIAAGTVAREVERKSILLLMARPIPRWTLILGRWSEMAVVLALLSIVAFLGTVLGAAIAGIGPLVDDGRFAIVTLNAFFLFLAVGGLALLISSAASDGGRATALVVAVAVVMFLVDFLAGIWSPFEPLAPLSLFHYYDPVTTAALGGVPYRDITVLAVVAVVALGAAFAVFQRRDLR